MGCSEGKAAIAKLLDDRRCNSVILTLGEEGALYASQTERQPLHVLAPKVDRVIDTTVSRFSVDAIIIQAIIYIGVAGCGRRFRRSARVACRLLSGFADEQERRDRLPPLVAVCAKVRDADQFQQRERCTISPRQRLNRNTIRFDSIIHSPHSLFISIENIHLHNLVYPALPCDYTSQ